MKYRVKNWRTFQHYKDRNPPWIKLHFAILSSRDWVTLDDASRVLAVACMLIASRNEGQIDGSRSGLEYLKRVAYLKRIPDLKPLIESGFLESASADASELLASPVSETENPTEKKAGQKTRVPKDFSISERVKEWALEKGFAKYLDAHFEVFMSYVRKKQPKYADWDEGLMGCIRDDWGDVRKKAGAVALTDVRPSRTCSDCKQQTFTWKADRCDPCWRKYMGIAA